MFKRFEPGPTVSEVFALPTEPQSCPYLRNSLKQTCKFVFLARKADEFLFTSEARERFSENGPKNSWFKVSFGRSEKAICIWKREKKISVLKKAIISKLFPGGSLISTSFDGKSLALKLFQLFLATGEWALELPYLRYLACCRFQLKGSNLILFLWITENVWTEGFNLIQLSFVRGR